MLWRVRVPRKRSKSGLKEPPILGTALFYTDPSFQTFQTKNVSLISLCSLAHLFQYRVANKSNELFITVMFRCRHRPTSSLDPLKIFEWTLVFSRHSVVCVLLERPITRSCLNSMSFDTTCIVTIINIPHKKRLWERGSSKTSWKFYHNHHHLHIHCCCCCCKENEQRELKPRTKGGH